MIEFSRFALANGLRVVVNEDHTTPLVSLALVYDVGSADEDPSRTGFAHLFEHLMFGGSRHIPDFDRPLQLAGGVNNAYTCQDHTCYYCSLPAQHLETALWLESDRMLSLAFSPQSLEVQRKVVVEEFKQTSLNAPYGDVSHLLSALTYREHPYRWPTIGLRPEHVEQATLEEVRAFFARHYLPSNAVLTLSGAITPARAQELVQKWFGDIPSGDHKPRALPAEPIQTAAREEEVVRDVPADLLVMTFPMCGCYDASYPVYDVISDILSNGESSRLQSQLMRQRGLFSNIDAVVSGTRDPGLFMVSGALTPGVHFEEAERAVWDMLQGFAPVQAQELEKVKNQFEATKVFHELKASNRAKSLAIAELNVGAEAVNTRLTQQRAVTLSQVHELAQKTFEPARSCTLRYRARRTA